MKSLMKVLAVKAILFLMTTSAAAQTSAPIVQTFWTANQVAGFLPCLNHGKGEWVVFSIAKETTIVSYTVTNGARNGLYMYTPTDPRGGGLTGRGFTTGILYTARGASQQRFSNWTPDAPGSVGIGDGQFVIDDNYYVSSSSPVSNYIWHQTTRFEIADNGNTPTNHPVETVCR